MPENIKIITIDGPAGAGKTDAAKYLARELPGFVYLNTDLIYRALAVAANRNLSIQNTAMAIRFDPGPVMILHGEYITDAGLNASETIRKAARLMDDSSMIPTVRDIIRNNITSNIIAEGHNAGLRIFPDAWLKFYLQAQPHIGSKRRQITGRSAISMDDILKELKTGDNQDNAPDGAIWLNTGVIPEPAVQAFMYDIVMAKLSQE